MPTRATADQGRVTSSPRGVRSVRDLNSPPVMRSMDGRIRHRSRMIHRPMPAGLDALPSRLRERAHYCGLGGVPALLIEKDERPRPFLLWLHGRTADKETDPGRYLRCIRSGINVCAVDLPGHGERFDAQSQTAAAAMTVITTMAEELKGVLVDLTRRGSFDLSRSAIGGMSGGGMAAICALTGQHPFRAAILEAACGAWLDAERASTLRWPAALADIAQHDPATHLDGWREIPILAVHARGDRRVPFDAQMAFLNLLRDRYEHPEAIEVFALDHTGAADEHVGFGKQSATVKAREVAFLTEHLQ